MAGWGHAERPDQGLAHEHVILVPLWWCSWWEEGGLALEEGSPSQPGDMGQDDLEDP